MIMNKKTFAAAVLAVAAVSLMPLLVLASAKAAYGNLTETAVVGKTLSVGLNPLPNGGWVILSNSNPAAAAAAVTASAVNIAGQAVGKTVISVCDSGGSGCLRINVTVVGSVLGLSTGLAHPAGAWVLGADGKTVYYVSDAGLIPITTWKIFLSNGGKANKIVPINDSDQTLPLLAFMTLKDSRAR